MFPPRTLAAARQARQQSQELPLRLLLLVDNGDSAECRRHRIGGDRSALRDPARQLGDRCGIVRTEPIDIALIDLTLPDESGCDSPFALNVEAPDLPLVAFTGRDFDDLDLDLVHYGVRDFCAAARLQCSAFTKR